MSFARSKNWQDQPVEVREALLAHLRDSNEAVATTPLTRVQLAQACDLEPDLKGL